MTSATDRRTRIAVLAAVIVVLIGFVFMRPLADFFEDIAFLLAPSGARAAAFGDMHFGASAAIYDIDRAEYFYQKAAALDPQYPYVYHQLARIEFLKGNFNTAVFYINKQIELHGDTAPSSYYVKGLIEGYMGRYADAAKDYEHYLSLVPPNWAGMNDYAWVLLKAGRAADAVPETQRGLVLFPDNAWLLNTSAIGLFETGKLKEALAHAKAAVEASGKITESQWLTAYPGNDPKVAQEGIATLRKSSEDNMHMIEAALASSPVR